MESEGSTVKHILGEIVTVGTSTYYELSNADGKQWILPARNMKTAFNLYQPSGWRGKLLKRFFPLLHKSKQIRNILHVKEYKYDLKPYLQAIYARVFDVDNVEFAIFMGTPSVHQKITVQLSNGDKILGYAKFSDNKDIIQLFKQEEQILMHLESSHITGVPTCLFRKYISYNTCMFLQSTRKTSHSRIIHEYNVFHTQFLQKLAYNTNRQILFEESDFYADITYLQSHSSVLGEENEELISRKIQEVWNYYRNKYVSFSVYHGDFTPWNMFVEKNDLFVFDWEYARMTYPPYLDFFHFMMQINLLEEQNGYSEIINYYKSVREKSTYLFANPEFSFCCYLLSILSQYVQREGISFPRDEFNMLVRFELLKKI